MMAIRLVYVLLVVLHISSIASFTTFEEEQPIHTGLAVF